jgi:pilus assembly protein TadC
MSGLPAALGAAVGPALVAVTAVAVWPPGPGPTAGSALLTARGRHSSAAPERPSDTVYAVADALSLLALALRAGLGPVEALETVADRLGGRVGRDLAVVAAAHRWGEDSAAAWTRVDDVWRPAALAWHAAALAGAAPGALLDAAAGQLREAEDERIEEAVQRAGVLLVLPLGLAFLPGFVCTTVVPIVLYLAAGFLGR